MRRLTVLALGTALATVCLAPTAYAATPPTKAPVAAPESSVPPPGWKRPMNAMGQPDLSGYWSNATLTPLTRNKRISDKANLTLAEASTLEALWAKALADSDAPTSADESTAAVNAKLADSKLVEIRPDFIAAGGDTGGYNTFWIDPGTHLVEINGQYRTSILTTDTGLPPARKAGAPAPKGGGYRDIYDSYENRSQGERCISGFGRNTGPPMLPNGYYNNNYQIVQTPDAVVINVEMIHDARIVRLTGGHRTDGLRPAMGDSIGRYEGDTLVVETTNLPETQQFMGSWKTLKVTEWFTRLSPSKILYRFQLEDPELWDKPWGGEYTFSTLKGIVYEYACHEGNYALPGILAGARQKEKEEAEAAAAKAAAPAKGKAGAD
ncbi:MAG: hypothetical protein KKE02_21180 [Alphaproteobacteria bacterium]|nr:hypothetical protein [Alphaproteobacteria bacterium]MBU1516207.1 hypothetical protein [Alphaproteobacteria bacterium]MBU2093517.1 hypothetical protein [Alphaproteobacteria bacterium]MBU2153545.1 hypothetical protein [Alphaproteobacteria bacterium]MBU2308179.1 hypothetical protein [Alphaproteobacteria bacterium]